MPPCFVKIGKYFYWIIRQFDKNRFERHIGRAGIPYSSPFFNFADITWDLKLNIREYDDQPCIYLTLTNFREPDTHYDVTLGLKAGEGIILRKADTTIGERFSAMIVKYSEITETGWDQMLPQCDLTVVCRIIPKGKGGERNNINGPEEYLWSKSIEKLLLDIKKTYLSGQNSDVVLRVNTNEFKAHRNILAARSPVFEAMFSHIMQENISGVVTIEDSDSDTFSDFLLYLYTGRIPEMTAGNAPSLYTTADKYQVPELKEECLDFMLKNMKEETIGHFLPLALRHRERKLIDAARSFLLEQEP